MIVKTEAIVLNSFKYGESSKIVTLYTKDYGKIKVVAKGARKSKNKFGSALDPLSYCQISFYHKPTTELFLLSDAEHIIPFRKIQDSLQHLSAGLIIIEAVNMTQDANEINNELFILLKETLKKLNDLPASPFSISSYLLIKLSELIGFAIDFKSFEEVCNSNGRTQDIKLNQKIFFSMESGSFIETNNSNELYCFDVKTADDLIRISETTLDEVGEINLDKKVIEQIHSFFNAYFSYHLERKSSFKTMNLFKSIL